MPRSRDAERDAWLTSQGFRIARFWNLDILGNPEGILTRVIALAEHSTRTPMGTSNVS